MGIQDENVTNRIINQLWITCENPHSYPQYPQVKVFEAEQRYVNCYIIR